MTYSESTTNSTEPANDAITAIEAALGAHAGWTFVEQVDFTQTSAKRARVWKCLGSQNNAGQDFYIALVKPTAAGTVTFTVRLFEGYNASTHAVIRPAPQPSTAAQAVSAADWSIGNGTEFAFSVAVGSAGSQADAGISLQASAAVDHFIVVSKSFLAYSTNSSNAALANGAFYVGDYTPAYSGGYNPVVLVGMSSVATLQGNATRFPNYPNTGPGQVSDGYLLAATPPNGLVNATNTNPDKAQNKLEAATVIVAGMGITQAAAGAVNFGSVRGSLPSSVALIPNETAAPRNGDLITVGGVDYFRCGSITAMGPGQANRGFYLAKAVAW